MFTETTTPTSTLHFRQWFTGPVVTYDEAAHVLPPELAAEDNIEWIEAKDYVRIERAVRRSDAPPQYGTVRRVNADAQYALVELETSGFWEYFHISELYLVMKAALETAATPAAEATGAGR